MSGHDNADTLSPEELARQCADAMWAGDKVSQNLGMNIEHVAPGAAVLTMTVRDDMVNGHDICHGGMVFSLADSAFAFSCNTENNVTVSSHCSIDFIRPAFKGDTLTAKSSVSYQGRKSGIYHIEVTNQNGKQVALFKGNASRLDRPLITLDGDT